MNEKNLKKLYDEYAEKTAPDMEKLWDRIKESTDKETAEKRYDTPKEIKSDKKCGIEAASHRRSKKPQKWLYAAACIALIVFGIRIFTNPAADINVLYNSGEEQKKIAKTSFQSLSLAYSGEKSYKDYNYSGGDYFVEKRVLEETEFFIDCTVTEADKRSGYCEYTLAVSNVICRENSEKRIAKKIKITSKTPYLMNKGGSYLLPMKQEGREYRIVFENAPQIEFTEDGEIVFHNGWSSLSEDSAECIYPKEGIDDFYYDRMRIAYTDSIGALIEEWQSV